VHSHRRALVGCHRKNAWSRKIGTGTALAVLITRTDPLALAAEGWC
jgi:hypothetical protein